jgi:hypothetical protein
MRFWPSFRITTKAKSDSIWGVTPAWEKLPEDVQFHLSPMAVNPMDLPLTITFISEAGYKIWVTQQDQTMKL